MRRPHVTPLSLSSRQSQLLIRLGLPLLFLHCIDYVIENTPDGLSRRDLTNLDLFSGEAAINLAFVGQNLKSKPFDKESQGDAGDITSTTGFLTAIQHTLRLKPGGLVTAGPPCGSFIFLNMGTSGRSKHRPLGCRRNYIQVANEICTRLILLLALAFIRGAVSLVEQPSSTLMLLFPYVCWFAKLVALFSNWLVTRFPMACYGHANVKPTVTFGCAPWSYRLRKKMSKSVKKRVQKAKPMVKKYVDANGKKRVCGQAKVLRRSQVYPAGYGRAICKHHTAWMEKPQNVKLLQDALYPPGGGFNETLLGKVPQAPYRWRHACLSKLESFLIEERNAGRYHPLISEGLGS